MRGIALAVVLLSGLVMLAGCAAPLASAPVPGALYTDVKGPLAATPLPTYSKVGTASCYSLLGLVALGDASIEAAMKNGGIKKIHHVDFKSYNLLGIYSKFTVIVYGE
ncbi:TRL-like protein family [Candidatus Poribacteria bacterium]|nr:MAG: TRL-like protein family [Candidatus Poribacteria bacterium]